jgi:dihydroorotate dehydrogenase electron transfer subunit
LRTDINKIRVVFIDEVIQQTPSVRTIFFKDNLCSRSKPGQFVMVWIPRAEELPMSLMLGNKKDYAAISIRKQGFGSTQLYNKIKGEMIGIRGPYGNNFEIKKKFRKVLLIGDGIGIIPLLKLITTLNEYSIDTTLIIGAKSKDEVLFEKLASDFLSKTTHKIIVTTEDGTYGIHGQVTDVVTHILETEKFDNVYISGPELTMKKIFDIASSHSLPVQSRLTRYMKCGIGICASCCIGDQLVCRDGTIFNEKKLRYMNEFGQIIRDKSGRKILLDYL